MARAPTRTSSISERSSLREKGARGEGGTAEGVLWLKGGSLNEIVSVNATVRHFCDEATGLATAGGGEMVRMFFVCGLFGA